MLLWRCKEEDEPVVDEGSPRGLDGGGPWVGGVRVRSSGSTRGGGASGRSDRRPQGGGGSPGDGRPWAGRSASSLGGVGLAGHAGGLRPGRHASALVVAREGDLRQERISLDRILRLAMGGLPPGQAEINWPRADRKVGTRPEDPVEMAGRENQGLRIFRKLGLGVLGGVFTAYAGLVVGDIPGTGQCSEEGEPFCVPGSSILVGTAGLALGTAAGVSVSDPRARYVPALVGSLAGLAGIFGFFTIGGEDLDPLDSWRFYGAAVFGIPALFATLASESSRDPPEDARLSFGLSPTPGRGVAAAASLRF